MPLLNFDDTEQIPTLTQEEVLSDILTAKNFDVDFEKMPLYQPMDDQIRGTLGGQSESIPKINGLKLSKETAPYPKNFSFASS